VVKPELRADRRRGAVAVEVAGIMIWVFMLLFGFFEYARLLMDWSLLNNAAREGCRYALVNNTSTTITTGVQGVVTSYMAGRTTSFNNFTVTVSGTHQGVATAVNSLEPGDPITVTVTGTYKFLNIIPLIHLPSSLSLTSSVMMMCEGGT
jgi:Flp pilus assembly protein TadG